MPAVPELAACILFLAKRGKRRQHTMFSKSICRSRVDVCRYTLIMVAVANQWDAAAIVSCEEIILFRRATLVGRPLSWQ